MINQKINAQKFINAMICLHRADENSPRMSLLDAQVLLIINDKKDIGKNEMLEIINGSTTSKSFLDRPISRLMRYGLIDSIEHEGVATQQGEPRTTYVVSKKGQKFLRGCADD